MRNIKQVTTGTLGPKNAAFVVLYTTPYKHYEENQCEKLHLHGKEVLLLGLLARRDGSFGFPGGKVDEGETLKQAALRELWEELGVVLDKYDLEPFCSHNLGNGMHTHVFTCETTPEFLYQIQERTQEATHFKNESAGFNVVHIDSSGDAAANLGLLPWSGSGEQEWGLLWATKFVELLG